MTSTPQQSHANCCAAGLCQKVRAPENGLISGNACASATRPPPNIAASFHQIEVRRRGEKRIRVDGPKPPSPADEFHAAAFCSSRSSAG